MNSDVPSTVAVSLEGYEIDMGGVEHPKTLTYTSRPTGPRAIRVDITDVTAAAAVAASGDCHRDKDRFGPGDSVLTVTTTNGGTSKFPTTNIMYP